MGLGLVKYVDQDGNEVKPPSKMRRLRYPVTGIVGTVLGVPAFLFVLSACMSGDGISSKLTVCGVVLFFYLGIVGLCFLFEGKEKGHW